MVQGYIAEWFQRLPVTSLAEAVGDATAAALFSTDMTVGFCKKGNLYSPRVGALIQPVVDLFKRLHGYGVRHFVLTQDAHHPAAPEFGAYPPHCVVGSEEAQLIPELKALPFSGSFNIIEKNSLSPAINTSFDRWLGDHPGLRTAVVVGNCTDLCVYQVAMHLRMRANAFDIQGFKVVVPANEVDTYDIPAEAGA
ncbi:MAG: cysteine hydrolase, partial [Chloroflexi bacterium]|nr:cysteine hydrolase [Chloroflexota bacterium]